MEYTLEFVLMLNTSLSAEALVNQIRRAIPNAKWRNSNSFDLSDNWIEVWENEDYNPSLAADPKKGFLYYRYKVEANPIYKCADVDSQIKLAKDLKSKLEQLGCDIVICANFEDLL